MARTTSNTASDCFIRAYALCEGIKWQAAKRRLSSYFDAEKKGVDSALIKRNGLQGYSILTSGSHKTLNEAFQFKTGIIVISCGGGFGHASYWNGVRLIDYQYNRLHRKKYLSALEDWEAVHMVLVKQECSRFTVLRSRFSHWAKIMLRRAG